LPTTATGRDVGVKHGLTTADCATIRFATRVVAQLPWWARKAIMSGNQRVVSVERKRSAGELPSGLGEGAALVQWLWARGHWDELAAKLQVRREGGFVGVDVLLFLLLFFATGVHRSLKRFGQWTAPFRKELAGLGGRKAFATPSSVSRYLSAVQFADVRALTRWLIVEACDAAALLQHPAAAAYDTHGVAWHAFDWDGTSTVLRHRALPLGDDLPAPARRSAQTGSAGYTGRKRGEIRFMRATLQHAGTGLWLDAVLSPERSDTAAMLPSALDAIDTTCRKAGLARDRVVLRTDGCGGNVPFIATCLKRQTPFLVRSAHYGLLEEPAIAKALREAAWYEVPSSGSGPTRLAAELGDLLLHPSKNTTTDEGERFEAVRVRMVVSRFAAAEKSGAGIVIDGWQYELYATDLPASAWPAAETVELYYGRCGQENRFAQEDRELELDRIFSYNLPGQELATVVALFLWNWRTIVGFAENPPPQRQPTRAARQAVVAESLLDAIVRGATQCTADAPGMASLDSAASVEEPTLTTAVDGATPSSSEPSTSALDPSLRILLNQLPWDEITEDLPPNWERAETADALRCPAGAQLPVRAITAPRNGRAPRVEFLASLSSCRSCSPELRCIDAAATGSAKKVTRAIAPPLAAALHPLLANKAAKRARRDSDRGRHLPTPTAWSTNASPSPLIARNDHHWAGPFATIPPLLLPAQLRRIAKDALGSLEVRIEIVTPLREPRHPALASSAADRQHRRLTWPQRRERNALDPGASVSIYLIGDAAVVKRHLPDAKVSCLAA